MSVVIATTLGRHEVESATREILGEGVSIYESEGLSGNPETVVALVGLGAQLIWSVRSIVTVLLTRDRSVRVTVDGVEIVVGNAADLERVLKSLS
ncbi:hypothetical protein ABFU82_09560 [Nocardioides sp. WV_118_6]